MPTLRGAWRTINRFIACLNTPVTIDRNTEAMRKDRRAQRKALILLMTLLNPEQRQEFRESGYFHVIGGSSGGRYRIRIGRIANIDALRDNGGDLALRRWRRRTCPTKSLTNARIRPES